jgi:hypothetical protein
MDMFVMVVVVQLSGVTEVAEGPVVMARQMVPVTEVTGKKAMFVVLWTEQVTEQGTSTTKTLPR